MYDKAKWHFESVDELSGDPDDAYAPGAYFFAWAAENDLLASTRCSGSFAAAVEQFRRREITGVQLYRMAGGVLDSHDLRSQAAQFADHYLARGTNEYLLDLRRHLPPGVKHDLALGWRWEVYGNLATTISKRYEAWRSGRAPQAC